MSEIGWGTGSKTGRFYGPVKARTGLGAGRHGTEDSEGCALWAPRGGGRHSRRSCAGARRAPVSGGPLEMSKRTGGRAGEASWTAGAVSTRPGQGRGREGVEDPDSRSVSRAGATRTSRGEGEFYISSTQEPKIKELPYGRALYCSFLYKLIYAYKNT